MKHHALVVGLTFSLTVAVVICGCGDKCAPTTPCITKLINFTISGNTSTTGVGQTSALTGTASYSDGSTSDRTSQAAWSSDRPSVAKVSAAGIVTSTGLGQAFITAQFSGVSKTLMVKVTPPGTFTVSGRVREPGGGALAGVSVVELESGQSTLTDFNGYSLGGLTSGHLTFDLTGYEPAQVEATPDGVNDVPMQRILRMTAGASITPELAPHDMDYLVDGNQHCYPCKLIRISGVAPGTLHLQVSWSEPHSILGLWVGGAVFSGTQVGPSQLGADVSVGGGEVLAYVGKISSAAAMNYVPFTLSVTSTVSHLSGGR